ncbi:MAG: zinc ribbon domain-containing protein [Candidatus Contendobacter sp.]|nr:zinc ribbon domain-containing protein [Candidatus Contendobacter sp.]
MPIYEYRCQSCNHELEVLQKLSDPELSDCPSCSQPELTKLISAVGFRLKGSGWYETDFKSGNQKNIAKSDAASVSDSTASSACDSASSCSACPVAVAVAAAA